MFRQQIQGKGGRNAHILKELFITKKQYFLRNKEADRTINA